MPQSNDIEGDLTWRVGRIGRRRQCIRRPPLPEPSGLSFDLDNRCKLSKSSQTPQLIIAHQTTVVCPLTQTAVTHSLKLACCLKRNVTWKYTWALSQYRDPENWTCLSVGSFGSLITHTPSPTFYIHFIRFSLYTHLTNIAPWELQVSLGLTGCTSFPQVKCWDSRGGESLPSLPAPSSFLFPEMDKKSIINAMLVLMPFLHIFWTALLKMPQDIYCSPCFHLKILPFTYRTAWTAKNVTIYTHIHI